MVAPAHGLRLQGPHGPPDFRTGAGVRPPATSGAVVWLRPQRKDAVEGLASATGAAAGATGSAVVAPASESPSSASKVKIRSSLDFMKSPFTVDEVHTSTDQGA